MKIGLALGAGGAKGYAHLGIIRALEEAGMEIHLVSGTSIGALVGAIYAAGRFEDMEEFALGIRLSDLPKIFTPAFSKLGFLSGNYINAILKKFIGKENIEDLNIPFAAVAADLDMGERVVFSSGSIESAVRASVAIPGLFTPVVDGNRCLVDGGAVDPVPVEVARDMGAEKVIAVDLISNHGPFVGSSDIKSFFSRFPLRSRLNGMGNYFKSLGNSFYVLGGKERNPFSSKTIFDIIQRVSVVTQKRLIELNFQKSPPDILLRPEVSDIGMLDFHKASAGIGAGKKCVENNMHILRDLL